jgi:hypothetical protein
VMYMVPPGAAQLKQLEAAVSSGKVKLGSSAWSAYELYCHPIGVTTT